jgi:hypothetical protein
MKSILFLLLFIVHYGISHAQVSAGIGLGQQFGFGGGIRLGIKHNKFEPSLSYGLLFGQNTINTGKLPVQVFSLGLTYYITKEKRNSYYFKNSWSLCYSNYVAHKNQENYSAFQFYTISRNIEHIRKFLFGNIKYGLGCGIVRKDKSLNGQRIVPVPVITIGYIYHFEKKDK